MDRQQKLPQPWTFVGRSAASHIAHFCEAHSMLTCRLVKRLQLCPAARPGPAAFTCSLAAAALAVTQTLVLT